MAVKLENLPGDPGALEKRKRVGRGESSGWGKTCGRGTKGQAQRSGTPKGKSFEGGQTPLTRRLPKRGFSHKAWSVRTKVVSLARLNHFPEGSTVDLAAMVKAGVVSGKIPRVKILGNGELSKKLTVVAAAFSSSAREKIEAVGGSCRVAPEREAGPPPAPGA